MIILYVIALIPIIVGSILFYLNKNIIWWEWLAGAGIAILTAMIFNYFAYRGLVGDQETWSGQITNVRQFSQWLEFYKEAIYKTEYYTTTESYYDSSSKSTRTRTVRKSRRVFSHWEDRTRNHPEYWVAYSNIETNYNINKPDYLFLVEKFGGAKSIQGVRHTSEHDSKMIGGDPNDYIAAKPRDGYIHPVTKSVFFENRLKATRNIFKFESVNEKQAQQLKLFNYPAAAGFGATKRYMTIVPEAPKAALARRLDDLNAILGPTYHINIIIINWGSNDISIASKQLGYWGPSKKNDFIIQYGKNWATVFSWSESELCKRNVESIFIEDQDLEKLGKEVTARYKLVNWHKFDYLNIEPTSNQLILYIFIVVLLQGGIFIYFHHNEFQK